MGKLSINRYASLCVVGGVVAYTACLIYGTMLVGEAAKLHHAIFELIPGFTWISFGSWLVGAITVAVWSGLGGAFIAWMHNYSLKNQ